MKASRLLPLALAGLTAGPALAGPPPELPHHDHGEIIAFDPRVTLEDILRHSNFKPSELSLEAIRAEGGEYDPDAPVDFDAVPRAPIAATGERVHVIDELVVFEGDTEIVTDFGNGRYGLRYDNQRQDPIRVAQRYFEHFGDTVDFIAVWTSFRDRGADGLAYYVPVLQDTFGLGEDRFDQRRIWGSGEGGRFQGFLNMKSIDTYGDIEDEGNFVYPVVGQELTHRWLAYFKVRMPDGTISDATLGRDDAHWSSLLDADASVQDGHSWRDNGDGSFTVTETMARFSPLDLYGMGLYEADEVPPFFLIEDATYRGQGVNPASTLPVGLTVQGRRTELTIDDIVAANGLRRPTPAESPKEFRMAFILITAPGQTVDDVAGQIQTINTFREIWERKYTEWTYGRSTICTRATAECDRPLLRIASSSVREAEGDGDDMVSPGETATISFAVENRGGSPAESARLHVVIPDGVDIIARQTPYELGTIASGTTREVDTGITLEIGADAPCGTDVRLKLEAATGELLTTGELLLPIGYDYTFIDDFEADLGWQVNAQGLDNAEAGGFERDVPDGVNARDAGINFQTQPASGLAGGGKAWVTGARAGQELGSNDLDGGATSVTSPEIPVGELRDPWIGYFTWHTALDFNSQRYRVVADDNDPLVVEISPDGGATWVLVEEDRTNEQAWLEKRFRILDLLPELPATIRLRFTAMDMEPQSLSEAAFDLVRVWDLKEACYGLPEEPVEPEVPGEPGGEGPGTPGSGDDPQLVAGIQDGGCAGAGVGALPGLVLGLGLLSALVFRRRRPAC